MPVVLALAAARPRAHVFLLSARQHTWMTKMAWERLLRALPSVRSVLRRYAAYSSLRCRWGCAGRQAGSSG